MKTKPTCKYCGSHDLVFDATSTWDMEKQCFIHSATLDGVCCNACGEDDDRAVWVEIPKEAA